jgi:hypothetical protein
MASSTGIAQVTFPPALRRSVRALLMVAGGGSGGSSFGMQ